MDFYNSKVKGEESNAILKEMMGFSMTISEEVEYYSHCDYQTAIASIVLASNELFTIVVSPTGSGKTWIQGLIAYYHCIKGEEVTIVEPNEALR